MYIPHDLDTLSVTVISFDITKVTNIDNLDGV